MCSRRIKVMVWAALAALAVGLLPVSGAGAAPGVRQGEFGACGDPATPIHDIQGTGERTPVGGQVFTIEGVVVGDYQDQNTEFGGFYVEEEAADADSDPLTSEGIFIDSKLSRVDVAAGDVVRVTGSAFELSDSGVSLTLLRRVKEILVCESGASVEPVEITLPVEAVADLERYEGMLVTFPQELTISEVYNLGRYGELLLSADGRLFEPTHIARPGDPALAVLADNARRSITLDDGNNQQNVDPTRYPVGGLSAANDLRDGDTVTGVTGVLDQRFGDYCIQPVGTFEFTPSNLRPAEPPDVGGRIRVASFNVLNYFNGDGAGGGFPTARGADTPEEFTRQRDKIISAILALDADVIGLMEIENDGDGPDSAVADLVNGLNTQAGADVYAYVADPAGLELPIPGGSETEGGDEIKQAIIYQTATVAPVGDPVATLDPPFGTRRPPVAQAFEEIATGEQFVVVVNHFKSKGCTGAGVDPDTGDGQGCWNQERTQAARTLLDWLATDPTGTGDPDALVIGDLNAYAMEDPLMVFADAGYTNLAIEYEGAESYSYVYFGQAGSLDHAVASPEIFPQVTGAAIWHINADEPPVLDYNVEFKSANHVTSLYDPGPFRASDHDPVVVGLALSSAAEATATPLPTDTPEPPASDTPAPPASDTPAPPASDTPAPTETPPSDDTDSDEDGTPGLVAVIVGLVAVAIAMIGGFLVQRRKR